MNMTYHLFHNLAFSVLLGDQRVPMKTFGENSGAEMLVVNVIVGYTY